jgi:hypothetical protein
MHCRSKVGTVSGGIYEFSRLDCIDWCYAYRCLLGEIVGLLETSFPQRVAGYYVQGSPREAQQRHALRELCRENLAFENHFLLRYTEYLVRELRGGEREGQLAAMLALGYYERWEVAISDAVRALVDHPDDQTRRAAAGLLAAHRRA